MLIGDPLRVNQILLNLLSNAYKFTPPGGCIRFMVTEHGVKGRQAFFCFSVKDNGVGMPADFMNRIFLPFEQQDSSIARRFGGSGLGLSIIHNLVKLMGGTIQVQSKEGEGSTFTVELPFELPPEYYQPKVKKDFSEIRMLVVDDDHDTRHYTSAILERMHIHHDCAASGEEALHKFEDVIRLGSTYDICIIDWKMPGMNGLQTAATLREKFGRDTTIIIASAYDFSEMETEALQAGVDMCIAKPLFQSTIFNLLMDLTDGKYSQHDTTEQAPGFDFTGHHFLIAEDNLINMEVAVGLLDMVGASVDKAVTGREALEKFEAAPPGTYDLILMDIQMPVMDGMEATRCIRNASHPEAKTIPILAMTANAFTEDVAAVYAAGMNDHIAKPIDTQAMYAIIAKYIQKPAATADRTAAEKPKETA